MRGALTVAAAVLCLPASACGGGAPGGDPARPTGSPGAAARSTPPSPVRSTAPIPGCEAIVARYPKGIYRSVGPYPGWTGSAEADLEHRYCNTAGYAAADGTVVLTTVVTIYRPTTDPYRGIPLATWQPQRVSELIAERCAGATVNSWDGGDGGRRCATESPDGVAQAVAAGGRDGTVLRVEVSGKLPRAQVESAADAIARALLTGLP